MTAAVTTDAPCLCGCAKWDHKQGRSTCKNCGCQVYDPADQPELEKLRAQIAQLERAVTVITGERDDTRREANDAANKTARLRLRCEHLEREVTHAQSLVDEAREQRTKAEAKLADAEAALVEANSARRMRVTEEEHDRIARAALVISRESAFECLRCRDRYYFDDVNHACGPMTPVDVIIARRLREQP